MINQLFKQVPDLEFLNKLLNCFGLQDLEDKVNLQKIILLK